MHANYTSRPDVKLPHWARANGWAIWAMSDVLMALPKNHPKIQSNTQAISDFCLFSDKISELTDSGIM